MKDVFEILTSTLSIVDDPILDIVIISIIGAVAFGIAWRFVGEIGVRGKLGSIIHWTVRLFVMVTLCYLVSGIINFIKFVMSIPKEWWINLGAILLIAFLVYISIKLTFFSKDEKKERKLISNKTKYQQIYNFIIEQYYLNNNKEIDKNVLIEKIKDSEIIQNIEEMLINRNLIIIEKETYSINYETILYLESMLRDTLTYRLASLAFLVSFIPYFSDNVKNINVDLGNFVSFIMFISLIIVIFTIFPKNNKI